jgi:flagellar hook-length control protein FliK
MDVTPIALQTQRETQAASAAAAAVSGDKDGSFARMVDRLTRRSDETEQGASAKPRAETAERSREDRRAQRADTTRRSGADRQASRADEPERTDAPVRARTDKTAAPADAAPPAENEAAPVPAGETPDTARDSKAETAAPAKNETRPARPNRPRKDGSTVSDTLLAPGTPLGADAVAEIEDAAMPQTGDTAEVPGETVTADATPMETEAVPATTVPEETVVATVVPPPPPPPAAVAASTAASPVLPEAEPVEDVPALAAIPPADPALAETPEPVETPDPATENAAPKADDAETSKAPAPNAPLETAKTPAGKTGRKDDAERALAAAVPMTAAAVQTAPATEAVAPARDADTKPAKNGGDAVAATPLAAVADDAKAPAESAPAERQPAEGTNKAQAASSGTASNDGQPPQSDSGNDAGRQPAASTAATPGVTAGKAVPDAATPVAAPTAPTETASSADAPITGIAGAGAANAAHGADGLTHVAMARSARGAATPAAVPDQLSASIRHNVKAGNDSFSIQLRPDELGRVDIRLEIGQDGRVSANVAVERPQTLELLMRDQRGLERALQDAGLKTDSQSLSFSLRDGSPSQDGGEGRQTSQGGGRGSRGRLAAEDPSAQAASTANYTVSLAPGRVDVHV